MQQRSTSYAQKPIEQLCRHVIRDQNHEKQVHNLMHDCYWNHGACWFKSGNFLVFLEQIKKKNTSYSTPFDTTKNEAYQMIYM